MDKEKVALAKHLINFCVSKGIKSDPLPYEYIKAGWFLVPLDKVKEVNLEIERINGSKRNRN